ncbi:hypothetical protein PR202_gb14130 [Eleusine coracana subsp. coracana]|uniref:Exonuclease domain-containing protein n=1 Tax=Eleusine coracana subsp. coracana TaxID=191504 RepID=A0AAV5EUL3_ELECO|nr:hypothetical protein PR202_gb14130 [Eleusine coracana subsp. coracana]
MLRAVPEEGLVARPEILRDPLLSFSCPGWPRRVFFPAVFPLPPPPPPTSPRRAAARCSRAVVRWPSGSPAPRKKVLVEVVRFTQKNGLKGSGGAWKDFLDKNDKKYGASVSDPQKRTRDVLLAFLQTFSKDFQKYFGKLVKRHKERSAFQQHMKQFPDKVSPEQKLVELTVEHPEYRKNYNFPSYQEGWKVLRIRGASDLMSSSAMLAIDCEMVLCHDGTEAVVRVCVVDNNLEVKLDMLINPSKAIADYRTHITAVSKKDLDGVTTSLADVQKSLKKMLGKGYILIGHSVYRDLCALKIDYSQVIDTAHIFKYANLPTTTSPSLNNLCKVAESDALKLLAHRIPVYLPSRELCKIFSGNARIDDKIDARIRGGFYSTFISFNDRDEVEKAFEELDGQVNKDSSGRLQKQVLLKHDNGDVAIFYVRKMVYGSRLNQSEDPKKRPRPTEDGDLKQENSDRDQPKKKRKSKKHVNKAE